MISLVRDKYQVKEDFLEQKILSRFYPPLMSGWTLNKLFPKLMFKLDWLKDKWIHYCNPMFPVNHEDKRIVTFHDFLFNFNTKDGHSYDHKLIEKFRECPYLLSDSNHTANEGYNYGFKENFTVLRPSGKEYHKVVGLKKPKEFEGKKLILSVGTTIKRKNPEMIKKVVNELGSDYILVRVGAPLGANHEKVYQNLDFQTMNYLYNICDVLFFPSHDEGFGYPPIEALKTGLPSVVSDIDIFRETLGDAAIFVDRNSVESGIGGIVEAIEGKSELEKRQIPWRQFYTPERFEKELLEFYSQRVGAEI